MLGKTCTEIGRSEMKISSRAEQIVQREQKETRIEQETGSVSKPRQKLRSCDTN
jgi:hypothetical protein